MSRGERMRIPDRTAVLRRAGGLAAAGFVGVALTATPASADVTSLGGGAFGARATATVPLVGAVTVPPTPSVVLPAGGGGPITRTALGATVPGLLTTGVLTATTSGDTAVSHLRTARSSATVADVDLGAGALTATAVSSRCASNGDGSAGSTTLLGLGGVVGLSSTPAPNTTLQIAGLGSVTFNEQIVTNAPGSSTTITVNAIHVRLAAGLVAGTSADIILGQSRCAAFGPDVLVGEGLPRTGGEPWQAGLAAGGLLTAGLGALWSASRRRSAVAG